MPFWLWMAWLVTQWFELVRILQAEPWRSNSVGVFHSIQMAFFFCALIVPAFSFEVHDLSLLPSMIITVETAVIVFLANYFLLALGTRTRPCWHAVSATALAIGSLSYEIWSVTRTPH